jgi:hypothetical protein
MMNTQFQSWFESGKIVEALCGHGGYFVADHTYREHHDVILAVGQLFDWSAQGHAEQSAKGFEVAVAKLLEDQDIEHALGLLLGYSIIKRDNRRILSIDENRLESLVEQKVRECGDIFVKNESLRNMLIRVIGYFPQLGQKLGVNKTFNITDKFA